MLGKQHLRKVMLGGDVVWQKHRPKPPGIQELTLESLDHHGIKLIAKNQEGNLFFPMFFPPRTIDDEQWFLGKLTFSGDTELSLQSIDAMLEADVVGKDMHFPMFFFDRHPLGETAAEGYDFRNKLTFIANIPMQLGLESLDGMLVAEVLGERDMFFPMVFPDRKPLNRLDFLNRLTFIDKEAADESDIDFIADFLINAYDSETDYIQDFFVNAFDSIYDFVKDFDVNAYKPDTDYMKDFDFEVLASPDYIKDFIVNAYHSEKDFLQDFLVNAFDPAKDFTLDFSANAYDPAKDFFRDFSISAYNPSTDYVKDFFTNAFDPTKDFVKDFTFSGMQAVDFTKTFNFQTITAVPYIKDFSATAIQTASYTKDFSFSAIQTVSYTKDFTATAVAQVTGNVLIVWVNSSTFTASPTVGGNVTHYLASRNIYTGSQPVLTFDAIMARMREHHGTSLTGSEISSNATSNNSITIPSGVRYVVYALQNVNHLIVTGNLTVSPPYPRIH